MPKNIEPKLRTIGDYLKLDGDAVFTVPEYQRAYSWGKEHCDKLWQDILDYQSDIKDGNKDRYFFGTIIINCQDNDTKYALIDGQQRTTTFLLLLKALLVRINTAIKRTANDEDSAGLYRGLQERRRRIMGILYKAETEEIWDKPDPAKDRELCGRPILLENQSINEQYQTDLEVILQAVDYIGAETAVTRIKYKKGDNKYTNFFRNYKFFYDKIDELTESELNNITKTITEKCEVIEIKSWQMEQAITMFNSLNSDGLPLYDSDIISAQMYAAAKRVGREQEFAELWKKFIDQADELEEMGIADVSAVMMQYMYYRRSVDKETVSKNGAINVTTPGLRKYYTDFIKRPGSDPFDMCETMLRLVDAWKKISAYPSAAVLFRFNENMKLFLAGYLLRFGSAEDIGEEEVETALLCLLRLFAVLELVDFGYSSSKFKTFLFGEAIKLVDQSISIETIKADFDKHICANWEKSELEERAKNYEGNMLVYLNEYLFAKEKDHKEFHLGSKPDIEHIMPSSGSNLQVIRKDAEIETEEEFRAVVHKLGNKVLLEVNINRSIGNEWFRTKVLHSVNDKKGYKDSQYPIALALVRTYETVDKPFWTKSDILKATEKASRRIAEFIFGG